MNLSSDLLDQSLNHEVVLDVASPYIYIGTLVGSDHRYLVLENADVHDLRDTTTTRDLYVLDARRHGLNANRKRVLVSRDQVVSLSRLDDVAE
jgi:small nuclear ribonucleoprotein (snRNP)-like protein